jgi:F-type H+-transporting ATPase subunit epsilon
MADKISFDLVSPERLLLSGEAEMVTLPGTEGEFGVLPGHAPVISTLKPGVIDVKGADGGDTRFFVLGGFAEVNPAKLTVLAEEAIPMAEVNAEALDRRIQNIQEDILTAKTEQARAKAVEVLDSLQVLRASL